MAISGCSSGLVVTAVVALLLLPTHYYVPDLYSGFEKPVPIKQSVNPGRALAWCNNAFVNLPPFELSLSILLLLLGFGTYLYEWIQRKLMERRITKVI